MAVLEVKTIVETEASDKKINGLVDSMEQLGKVQKESLAAQKKAGKEASRASTEGAKGTKMLSKGFKGVGMAIKGAGIGLLVGTIGLLVQAFKGNQKVMDVFASVMGAIGIVGNKIVTVLSDVVTEVDKSDDSFESVTKTVTGLITLALNPLKGVFFDLMQGIKMAQLAWELSFFGDKDPQTIVNLSKELTELDKAIKQNTTDMLLAGAQVANNYKKAMETVRALTTGIVEGISEIDVKSALATSKANIALEKAAKLAEAKITGLIEKYDLQAERQRQIRDNETQNIATRIEANEELGRILTKQQEEQTKLAQIGVDAARAKLAIDTQNIEAQVELERALNEVAATAAQVAGFESEQQTNRNALLREQKEIVEELSLLGKSEQERLILEADQERTRRLEQIDLFIEDEILKNERLAAVELDHTNTIKKINKDAQDAEDKTNKESADNEIELKKKTSGAALSIATNTIGLLGANAKKGTKQAKNMAVAGALIDTVRGAQAAFASANANVGATAGSFGAYPIAMAGLATAFGLANVAKIRSSPESGGGSVSPATGGGGASIPSASAPPRIPDFGAFNQGVGGGSGLPSNRAVVVNQDIRDSNAMDNRVNDLIRLGR